MIAKVQEFWQGLDKTMAVIVAIVTALGLNVDRVIFNDLQAIDSLSVWQQTHEEWSRDQTRVVRENLNTIKTNICFDKDLTDRELVYMELAVYCDSVKVNFRRGQ